MTTDLQTTTTVKQELEQKVDVASTLNASNIAITPVNEKKSGKEKVTATAKRVDKLVISFDVDNRIVQSGSNRSICMHHWSRWQSQYLLKHLVQVASLPVKKVKKYSLLKFLLILKQERKSMLNLPGNKIAISKKVTTRLKFITMVSKLVKPFAN